MDAGDDDATIARRISGGDAAAEGLLCRRLFPRIRAYGMVHLRDREAASDLAQEVLIILIRGLREGRVQELDRLAAYLSGVCRNVVRDWRKGARRQERLLELLGPASLEVEPPPSIDARRLAECLQRLGARDRSIVVLTYFAERSGHEIARQLDMSSGSVRVARHRALKHLYECVAGES